jgi:hypothetical protein
MSKIKRAIRAAKIVARDKRIPKPLRFIVGLSLLPIPGPLADQAIYKTMGWKFIYEAGMPHFTYEFRIRNRNAETS